MALIKVSKARKQAGLRICRMATRRTALGAVRSGVLSLSDPLQRSVFTVSKVGVMPTSAFASSILRAPLWRRNHPWLERLR